MFCIYRDNKTIENINKWRQRENGNNLRTKTIDNTY
jgi:hypothetical protein